MTHFIMLRSKPLQVVIKMPSQTATCPKQIQRHCHALKRSQKSLLNVDTQSFPCLPLDFQTKHPNSYNFLQLQSSILSGPSFQCGKDLRLNLS